MGERCVCPQAVTRENAGLSTDQYPRPIPIVVSMTEITDRAQELLAGRIDAIRKLNERQHAAAVAREAADAADREAAGAWSEATHAGWTAVELRKLGLSQPANRRGGRPKGSRSTKRAESAHVDSQPPNA